MVDQYYGLQQQTSPNDEHNLHDFHIRKVAKEIRTGIPVKVVAVYGGGPGAAPTIDVQPLVNQIDGQGNKTDHGVIYGIPVQRNQGGGNAIINDPKVGDIGHMHVADRDISSLKANDGGQSNPGSMRTHDLADGIYQGAILNPANPTQAVQFTDTGVKIFGAGGGVFEINGADVHITGNLYVSQGVTAGYGGGDAVTLQHHKHAGGPPPDPGT